VIGREPAGERPEREAPLRLEGAGKRTLEVVRTRLVMAATLFSVGFLALAVRLVEVTLLDVADSPSRAGTTVLGPALQRADIVDRNGVVLATNLESHSLYAVARLVRDPAATAARLAELVPGLDAAETERRLASRRGFVWIKRTLTPRQVYAVNRLGEPGLRFLREQRRVYPQGRLAAHVVGFTDIDKRGLAGIERRFDRALAARPGTALALSLDLRFQHALRDELAAAMAEFHAAGAAGVILDVDTGEVLALVSLPDFDPNRAGDPGDEAARFNRASLGVYEIGSAFKTFTTAMALDTGTVTLSDGYDASEPLVLARYTISDFHGEGRWLSVPEIFIHSSNIGAAKMALDVGGERQRAFLARLGLLAPAAIELPEVSAPIAPAPWREINTATIGFGHGIAVSPVQVAAAAAALVNGGVLHPPTLVRSAAGALPAGERVVRPETSRAMRRLFRLVVERGTGRQAEAEGYLVGGKTGTAEKSGANGYDRRRLLSSFLAAFPIDRPRYVVFAVLDEPKGTERTLGYATGGWTAAPAVGRIVARIGSLAGIAPRRPAAGEEDGEPPLDPDDTEIRLASF
jgi:cell division protein FtsI (penicillin-binding protein 3)